MHREASSILAEEIILREDREEVSSMQMIARKVFANANKTAIDTRKVIGPLVAHEDPATGDRLFRKA